LLPLKRITFSFDDGVTQDIRLIKILNRYGLKATFNLNSGLLGTETELDVCGVRVQHRKLRPDEVADIYCAHEVAVHTLTHPNLTQLSDAEVLAQVRDDAKNLERLVGYPMAGMAYPMGGVNQNAHVAALIRASTPLRYARTILSSYGFGTGGDLMRFHPTVYHMEWEKMLQLSDQFLALQPEQTQLLFLWGHSYELDATGRWEAFERFCAHIAGHDDVLYCTNPEALLAMPPPHTAFSRPEASKINQ
jgi:peptidoglycan/xylan/chitin deacetylase (PgdA/CDA1 family)